MSTTDQSQPTKATEKLLPISDDESFLKFIQAFTNYETMKNYRCDDETMPLERMRSLAESLGNPQDSVPSIHIAGTKGKGTTCLILETLLRKQGYRVGTYTSPHLKNLRERVRVDGKMISETDLVETLNSMLSELDRRYQLGPEAFPTFFEMMTALAMHHFQRAEVDVAIYEVGLGGRLDATNILQPEWTAITGIGLEHMDKLGNTLSSIAKEKAGIIKENTPLVLAEVDPEAREAIFSIAKSKSAPILETASKRVQAVTEDGKIAILIPPYGKALHPNNIRGPGPRADLGLAITIWEEFLAKRGQKAELQTIEKCLSELELPGRVEILHESPMTILDGAHTPESLASLAQALNEESVPRPRIGVVALAQDKRLEECLEQLGHFVDQVIFTQADSVRGADPQELSETFYKITQKESSWELDPHSAYENTKQSNCSVIVTGSIYLVGALQAKSSRLSP